MSLNRFIGLVTCAALIGWSGAFAAEPGGDVFKEHGLTKVGTFYVVPEETEVLDAMKSLRAAKADSDKEVKARALLEGQITAKHKIIKDTQKTWDDLNVKLPTIQRADQKNGMIVRMNRQVSDQKQAILAVKDLEEKSAKLSDSAQIKYIDSLAAFSEKASTASTRYTALADSADVKAAIAKANIATSAKLAIGPSTEFAAASAELAKWQAAVESESIPLREQTGIYRADVLLNGEKFQMIISTGNSSVTLPAAVAAQLKLIPGEKDPTIQLKLANGAIIKGKEMSLSTVRIGRFTVENVTCIVLEKGLPDPPLQLGNSFLSHFIVKMDASKSELHLTEVKQGSAPKAVSPGK